MEVLSYHCAHAYLNVVWGSKLKDRGDASLHGLVKVEGPVCGKEDHTIVARE